MVGAAHRPVHVVVGAQPPPYCCSRMARFCVARALLQTFRRVVVRRYNVWGTL